MKAKSKINFKGNHKGKGKAKLLLVLVCLIAIAITVSAKGKHREIVGYIYDTDSTLWEMAERHCPDDMDVRDFISEIRKANELDGCIVYKDRLYKIPVFEAKADYLDMNTVVGYETSDNGVLLITSDGNGYFIEK